MAMHQSFPDRRTVNSVGGRVAAHVAAARASRAARENHQRFVERSLRTSAEAHGRSAAAQRRLETNHNGAHGGAGFIGTIVRIVILAVVAYGLYTFVVSSVLLR